MKKIIFTAMALLLVLTLLQPTSPAYAFSGEVSVGAGSYTTALPPETSAPSYWDIDRVHGQLAYPVPQSTIYKTSNVTGPIPTSDWWSDLAWDPFSERQYPHPLAFWPKTGGLQVYYPGKSIGIMVDRFGWQRDIQANIQDSNAKDFMLGHSATSFPDAKVDGYSDWMVTASFASGSNSMKLTYGHGSPYVYGIFAGGNPKLTFPTAPTVFSGNANSAVLGIKTNGKYYALFGPTGSTWSGIGTTTLVNNLNGKNYFSLALLPDGLTDATAPAALSKYQQYAYSHVTNTQVSWNFDEATSMVTSTYNFTVTPKETGAPAATLFALYPHQWKNSATPLLNSYTYNSIRGKMIVGEGSSFSMSIKFNGILPVLPNKGTYNVNQLKTYLQQDGAENKYSPLYKTDTYFAGKELNRWTQIAAIADQVDPTLAPTARNKVKTALEDYLKASKSDGTQDPNAFFGYNSTWGTLIGYREGFYSAPLLSDHHFHYGYFIKAAADIARVDKTWASDAQWGGMVKMLIREIANPNRNDTMFPFLRNFDPYAGHSWANGKGHTADGNDQESVSEALNAWSGIIQWGEATGDKTLRDLGIYLYTTEMTAGDQYWFDVDNENLPADYNHSAVWMVFGGKSANATWWTDNPRLKFPILWLPLTASSLYLGYHPDYVKEQYDDMMGPSTTEYINAYGQGQYNSEEKWDDLSNMYYALYDPAAAIANLNALGTNFPTEIGNSHSNTYYWVHNLNALGRPDPSVTANYPIYAVFNKNGVRSYFVYNMKNTAITVDFSDGQRVTAQPNSFNTDNGVHIMDTIAPSTPTNVSVLRKSSNYVDLTWTASTDNRGVAGYEVYRNGVKVGTTSTTSYHDTGLSATTAYSYTVKAKDLDGLLSGASTALNVTTTAVDTTAPSVPTGLLQAASTTTSVTLAWNAAADNVQTTDYDVYRNGTLVGTVQGTSFTDKGLQAVTVYTYTVKARDAAGNTSAASAALQARTDLIQTGDFTQKITEPTTTQAKYSVVFGDTPSTVILNAKINGGGQSGYMMTNNNGTWEYTVPVPANATIDYFYTYIINGVGKDSQSFSYKMGLFSPPPADSQAPTAPTGLTSPSKTSSSVSLSWTASTDNVGVTGYDVYSGASLVASTTGATSVTVSGLSAGTSYTFTVKAKDAAGNVSAASSGLTVVTDATADTQAPTAPTGLTSPSKTSTSVSLSWSASTDNVGVTGYDVYSGASLVASTTGATSVTVSGLTANTSYTFTVKAKDAAGNVSAASSGLTVVTNASADTQAPTAPTGLTSPSKTSTSVSLSWTASTDNVGVTGYDVYSGASVVASTTGATSVTVSGLSAGTSYTFTVKAKDAAGNVSAASSGLTVVTDSGQTGGATSNVFFVRDGAAPGTPGALSNTAGSNAATDAVPSAGGQNLDVTSPASSQVVEWVSPAITGTYNSGGATVYTLYVDSGTSVGNAFKAQVQYDFNGDGTYDRTETFGYKATDPVAGNESYTTQGVQASGAALTNMTGGKVKLRVWMALGSGSTNTVRTDATSAQGSQSQLTIPYTVASGPADTQAPTAPTGLTSPSKTSSSVSLSWTASTDNVGVTGYDVFSGSTVVASTTGATSATVSGLSANTSYTFTVKAKDAAGNVSAASSAVSVTTNAGDTQAPTAPTGLAAPSKTSTSVNLSWTASTDNVGVTGYDVYSGSTVVASTTGATSATVSGLSANTSYTFTVKAKDAAGNVSAASSALSVTTNPLAGDFTDTITKLSASSAKWTFTPNPSATSVILHYTIAGQGQQNVNMSVNGTNWEYTVTSGLSAGAVVTYSYTYTLSGQGAKDSSNMSYTQP
ncbi:fibronectin type III domain-containing protein [Paenibacillus athensensis]|uniref:glucan endo-1,3-beta-D-glucosidase n=1 Tax=Paenibacillus athensensis TaxID=1967502 RepID=A0A4Y8Q3J4_9BACL|nr:glycosyl hydrolase [Paenibacillus athensensis]